MANFLVYGKAEVQCHAHVEADNEGEAMAKFQDLALVDTKWGEIKIVAEGIDDEEI